MAIRLTQRILAGPGALGIRCGYGRAGAVGKRALEAHIKCFNNEKTPALVRFTGDILALSPPLLISEDQIGQLVEAIRAALQSID